MAINPYRDEKFACKYCLRAVHQRINWSWTDRNSRGKKDLCEERCGAGSKRMTFRRSIRTHPKRAGGGREGDLSRGGRGARSVLLLWGGPGPVFFFFFFFFFFGRGGRAAARAGGRRIFGGGAGGWEPDHIAMERATKIPYQPAEREHGVEGGLPGGLAKSAGGLSHFRHNETKSKLVETSSCSRRLPSGPSVLEYHITTYA